ncbi:unnamed protein product [Heligmosomoides polygyrus]|uniref:Protein kinase domain-containing protein n=1 Tax=Heligmosomoides polygyrus TaxID=6339 RepID=A0A3P8DR78_HELPZ|nr:unnamed protein product [Heligmosomoides polygyrus]
MSHRRKSLKAELRDLPSGDEASSPNLATDDPFKSASEESSQLEKPWGAEEPKAEESRLKPRAFLQPSFIHRPFYTRSPEAKIMRRLDHPNIVRMYGVAPQEEPVMIILELAVNGSLKRNTIVSKYVEVFIKSYYKKNENVTNDKKLKFATDACRGMCYLSLEKIIHRDLAARNCLLGAAYEVKISDFGLSVADKSELRLNKLQKVPVKWLSPETINEGVFTTKTDVWSFGVLMWEIFANCKSDPFPGETNAQAVSLITGKTPPMEPPPGSPLLVKQSPDARADFGALLHVLAPSEAPPAVAAKTSSSDLNVHVTKSSETCLAKTKQPLAKLSVDFMRESTHHPSADLKMGLLVLFQ